MKALISEPPPSGFRHYDKKYICCCGTHVKTGAKILGIFEAFCLVSSIFNLCFSTQWDVFCYLGMVLDGPLAACLVLFFIGLFKRNSKYLVPFIVYELFGLLIGGMFVSISVVAYYNPFSYVRMCMIELIEGSLPSFYDGMLNDLRRQGTDVESLLIVSSAVGMVVGMILTCWFISIIYKCYRYLSDLEEYKRLPSYDI